MLSATRVLTEADDDAGRCGLAGIEDASREHTSSHDQVGTDESGQEQLPVMYGRRFQ
jgi:hypothetical protein